MTHVFKHPKYWAELRAEKRKLQASSSKPQADENFKLQASSPKQQASSSKPEVTSSMIREPRNI